MIESRPSTAFASIVLAALAAGCSSSSDAAGPGPVTGGGGEGGTSGLTASLDGIDLDADLDGDRVVDLPATVDPLLLRLFARYAAVEGPAGRVHILAQAGVDEARLRRARAILSQHLQPVAGLAEGAQKSDVFDAMVNRGAVYAVFADAASLEPSDPDVFEFMVATGSDAVAIPAERIVPEGTAAYLATLPAEDNTFGSTAALVLRTGLTPARPGFAEELGALRLAAVANGTYTPAAGLAPADEDGAFLALVMDVHSGVWGHDPNGDGTAGSDGRYDFASREDMLAGDPATLAWIERFFATGHSFEAVLPEDFSGNFDGLRRAATPYTSRSQHLRNIRLSGTNTAEIFGAPFASTLTGNDGNNNLKGRAGDDVLIGGLGFDTAVFTGVRANYTITFDGPTVIVEDVLGGHDGIDTLTGINRLQFADGGENL